MPTVKTIDYFKDKAEQYDLVDNQIYWVLSDALLWLQLKKHLKKLPENFSFLDAGGGTGRWSIKILQNFPKAKGTLFDISPDMLSVTIKKAAKLGYSKRLEIIQGDLLKPKELEGKSFDLSFNFHNVLGFVDNAPRALQNIAGHTKKGGLVISFVPNLYHSVYFNIGLNRLKEADYAIKNMKGRFTAEMPYINLFTPQSIQNLYKKSGIKIVELTGFPSVIYPNYQETQLTGSTKELADFLKVRSNFNKILEIEEILLTEPDIVSRGNNIFVVGVKNIN